MKHMKVILFSIVLVVAVLMVYTQQPFGYTDEMITAISKAEYVGSQRCAGCHKDQYESWLTTLHPHQERPASINTVVGDFTKNNTFKAGDYTTKMSTKDGKHYVTTIGRDGKEETYELKYVIGGAWKQRYLTEFPNGALHVLPVQWNVETKKWTDYHGLAKQKPGDGKYWSDKGRAWQYHCSGCHAVGVKINYDAKNDRFDTTLVERGIGCESCHGPGSEHLKAPLGLKSTTIVNPAKIHDAKRAAQICGQCHNRGVSVKNTESPYGPKHYEYSGGPAGYLPGLVLRSYYDEKPGEWPDGSPKMHRQQYVDWAKSKHALSGVNCWDCHAVHQKGALSKGSLKAPANELCLNCHKITNEGFHGIHTTNDCRGCHMPKTSQTAVKRGEAEFDISSHRFKFVSPSETLKHGGLAKQPNSCNACHYHEKDKPEDMMKVVEAVKNKRREQFGLGKVTISIEKPVDKVDKKEEAPKK